MDLTNYDFYPLGKRVLIEVIDHEKVDTVIELLDKQQNNYPQYGIIRRLGPEIVHHPHVADHLKLKEGMQVTFTKHSGLATSIQKGDTQYLLLEQGEIHSIMVKTQADNEEV